MCMAPAACLTLATAIPKYKILSPLISIDFANQSLRIKLVILILKSFTNFSKYSFSGLCIGISE